ncbi:MAG: arylsulfotransferase family protein [Planctomycetota bacterium]
MKRSAGLAVAALLLGSCGHEPGAPPTGGRPASQAAARDETAELAALGYSGWDELREPSEHAVGSGTDAAVRGTSPWPRAFADDRDRVTVVSTAGDVLRTLTVPGRTQVEFARFLPGGRVACVSVDEGLTLLAPDGSLLWAIDLPCHHEVALVPEGRAEGERRLAVAVHHEREHRGRRVRFDEVVFLEERDGSVAADLPPWRTHEHVAALMERVGRPHPLDEPPAPAAPQDTVYDYFHLNAVSFDGPGTMLVCLRNVDLVVEVTPDSGALGRSFGPGVLDWPHAPTPVADGARWLIFDNGKHRGWSRVIEVDPGTGRVTWSYPPAGERSLFSEVRGYAQRLPGGTTLITESERGRALEVDRGGAVLWEFWNPEVRTSPAGAEARRRIYRMTAVAPEDAGP